MSVSLMIQWADGTCEHVSIASQRGGDWWAEEARSLGLELIPMFASFLPVESGNLHQLIKEVTIFRETMASRGTGYEQAVEAADGLLRAFGRLENSAGWQASIG